MFHKECTGTRLEHNRILLFEKCQSRVHMHISSTHQKKKKNINSLSRARWQHLHYEGFIVFSVGMYYVYMRTALYDTFQ